MSKPQEEATTCNERGINFWRQTLAPYQRADTKRALIQLLTTLLPFLALWYLMLRSLEWSFIFTMLLAVPAAGLLVRLFIMQHDCGHGSFLPSQRGNDLVGFWLGFLTLTPYRYWRRTHAVHHATFGDLDRRGLGDIVTMTLAEYQNSSRWRRLSYRVYRHPLILFAIGPAFQFLIKHRFPLDAPRSWKKEWRSVMLTNLALVGALLIAAQTIGISRLLLVHVPIMLVAGGLGIWLFYVQHQFVPTYWERRASWSFERACLEGSSFYDLPPVLHWFTGNIGFHHVHHLASRVPNYRLQECYEAIPELQQVPRLTLRRSLRCLSLKLWDEERQQLVSFPRIRARSREVSACSQSAGARLNN